MPPEDELAIVPADSDGEEANAEDDRVIPFEPEQDYIEPLERAIEVMSIIEQRGWTALEVDEAAEGFATLVARVVVAGGAILATRTDKITAAVA